MTTTTATARNIHPALLPHVQAAHAAGFTVHVPVRVWSRASSAPVGYVYVTRAGSPGIALMQIPTFPLSEPIDIDVPVVPNREHGSAVPADHDGTPADAVRLLGELMEADTVMTRFVDRPRRVSVDRRIPDSALVYDCNGEHGSISEIFDCKPCAAIIDAGEASA